MTGTMKFALMMDLPEGKLPGFYSQVVKALGSKTNLFDRDKELLIVSSQNDSDMVEEVLQHYKIPFEPITLYLLPANAKIHSYLDDYGFTSRAENTYLYADLVAPFRFLGDTSPEQSQAYRQMCEHILASYSADGYSVYLVSSSLSDLILGIAKAYKCEVEFGD